jgi:hypothetical protein
MAGDLEKLPDDVIHGNPVSIWRRTPATSRIRLFRK